MLRVCAWLQAVASAGDPSSLGSTVVGTYGYMAPEQFRGAAQPASDLYGLGATLLYLISGTAVQARALARVHACARAGAAAAMQCPPTLRP